MKLEYFGKEKYKMPSHNERFGGRRGVTRGTLYRYFGSSPPVQAFVNPRPTAKPQGVIGNAPTAQWKRQVGQEYIN